MIELVAIALAILAAVYIGYPFYQARFRPFRFEANHRAEDLETRKAEIYAAIKDIEFDYQMGKLSEEDYTQLRNQYKAEAVQILKQLDAIAGAGVKPGKRKKAASAAAFCSNCGAPVRKSDRFCTECGASLQE